MHLLPVMDDSRLPTKDDSLLPTKDDSKSKEPKSHLSPRHNNSKPHHPSTTYASIHRNVFMEHPQNHPCQSGPAPDLASSRSTCECSEAPLEFPWFPWANGEQQFTGWGNQTIRFLAEGAANVVFRIVLPPDHADYAKFKGTQSIELFQAFTNNLQANCFAYGKTLNILSLLRWLMMTF